MVEGVAALDELGGLCVYSQLYFTYYLVSELHIDQDIIIGTLQAVLHPDNPQLIWVLNTDSLDFFVDVENFLFLGRALAPGDVSHLKS